jgi:DNA polymerase III subunit gamma/tau
MIAFRPLGEAELPRAAVGGAAAAAVPAGRAPGISGAAAARAAAAVGTGSPGRSTGPSAGQSGSGAGLHAPGPTSPSVGSAAPVAASSGSPAVTSHAGGGGELGDWASIVGRLELGGAARQLASNCALVGRQGAVVRLALDARNKHMRTQAQEEKLAQALSRYLGQTVRLEFETAATGTETPAQADQRASIEDMDAARRSLESDPGVQGFRDRFGATLLPDTVRPVK